MDMLILTVQLALLFATLDSAEGFAAVNGRSSNFVLPTTGCTCDTLSHRMHELKTGIPYAEFAALSCSSSNPNIADSTIDNDCNLCYGSFINSFNQNDQCWISAQQLHLQTNCKKWSDYMASGDTANANARKANIEAAIAAYRLGASSAAEYCGEEPEPPTSGPSKPCDEIDGKLKLGPLANNGESIDWCWRVRDMSVCPNVYVVKGDKVSFCGVRTVNGKQVCKLGAPEQRGIVCPLAAQIGLPGSNIEGQVLDTNQYDTDGPPASSTPGGSSGIPPSKQ